MKMYDEKGKPVKECNCMCHQIFKHCHCDCTEKKLLEEPFFKPETIKKIKLKNKVN